MKTPGKMVTCDGRGCNAKEFFEPGELEISDWVDIPGKGQFCEECKVDACAENREEMAGDLYEVNQLRHDAVTMSLRLLGEDQETFAPECAEVMARWKVELEKIGVLKV